MPTSVDRSIRLAPEPDGTATAACRPTGVAAGARLRVVVEYRVERAPTASATLLSLQSGAERRITVPIDSSGTPLAVVAEGEPVSGGDGPTMGSGVPVTSPAPAGWQGLDLTVDPSSGVVVWAVHDGSGAETRSGRGSFSGLGTRVLDTMCLFSSEGLASGWIAIDDLLIEG
jgi:hypothetical protein